jgi:hypothetical protein
LKTTQRINETKRWYFENINKIDEPVANLTKVRREKTQSNKIRTEKGRSQQALRKSKESSRTALKTYT